MDTTFQARAHRCSIAIAATLLMLGVGCTSGPFARRVSRERAIANCIESTPPETVLYADEFAACMERQGWAYSSKPS